MSGTRVTFPSNGGTTEGYLAIPQSGSGPGVIVLQEWWGLVPHIEDVCDRFAAEGFTALAPDLYHGETTTSPDDAGKLMMALNIAQTEKDLAGAVQFLVNHEAAAGDRVGVVGFCMGGQLSLFAATKNPSIGACVVYYGIHPEVKPDLASLKAPVMGFFAENDAMVPPAAVEDLRRRIEAAGGSADFTVYPGTDHAFFNDTRTEVHDPAAAGDSWKRMLAFYRTNLA
jgi:carboxymethylenebutenolidase